MCLKVVSIRSIESWRDSDEGKLQSWGLQSFRHSRLYLSRVFGNQVTQVTVPLKELPFPDVEAVISPSFSGHWSDHYFLMLSWTAAHLAAVVSTGRLIQQGFLLSLRLSFPLILTRFPTFRVFSLPDFHFYSSPESHHSDFQGYRPLSWVMMSGKSSAKRLMLKEA